MMRLVEDELGKQLTGDTDIRDRWRRYCENLYRAELDPNNGSTCAPRREEIDKAIKSVKDGKTAGPDEISSKLKLSHDSSTGKWPRIGPSPLSYSSTRKLIERYRTPARCY